MKENTPKILLTGGHAATTGIAVVEEIRKTDKLKNAEIYWIGSQTAIEGSKISTTESRIFPTMGIKFIPIIAGKIQTKFTKYTIPSILKIPAGFIQAFWFLLKIRPKVILSLGGFASFPVVFWAWLFRIPVILHEQTVVAGRASMAAAFFSRKIALARAESQKFFPKEKIIITGNPVMSSILSVPLIANHYSLSTILVMGGSRGSEFINEEIIKITPELIKKYKLIHITGESEYAKYKDFKYKNYEAVSFVDPREMFKYYQKADLIISRSGANTVSEIMVIKRPAILIPLPRTFMGEQVKNAEYARDFGIAKVMLETEVNSESLKNAIKDLIVHKVITKKSPDIDASKKIVNIIESYI